LDEALLTQIVIQVLTRLNISALGQSPKNVLVLFSGASSGVISGVEIIGRLARAGHTVTVVLTPSAHAIMGADRAREAGAQEVITPDVWANAPGLVREADLVLLPTLSMNMAARLAMGLLDSLVSTLVIGALLAGKPVVAVRDGADPDGNAGKVFGATGAAPALRARLHANLGTLAAYGMHLVGESEFLATVEQYLTASPQPAPALPAAPAAAVVNGQAVVHSQNGAGWITETDLLMIEPGTTLHLSPGSRVTPLARDTAQRLGIQLIRS